MKAFVFGVMCVLLVSCSSRPKVANPFYYEAIKDDKVIHILGTLHVSMDLDDFHPRVKEDLRHAEVICLEADEKLLEEYLRIYKDDYIKYAQTEFLNSYPLEKKLSPDAWNNLRFTLDQPEFQRTLSLWKIPVPPHQLNPLLTMEVIGDLINRNQIYAFPDIVFEKTRDIDPKWMSPNPGNLLDSEILKYARENHLHVRALDQRPGPGFFSSQSFEKKGLQFLEGFYGTGPGQSQIFSELREAYQKGDEARLKKLMKTQGTSGLDLITRNKQWADSVKWMLEKRIFIGVGVLHLIDKDNFLDLLEENGFMVRKIPLVLRK